jgi:hypothetical protein
MAFRAHLADSADRLRLTVTRSVAETGSIPVGKRADMILVEATRPAHRRPSQHEPGLEGRRDAVPGGDL